MTRVCQLHDSIEVQHHTLRHGGGATACMHNCSTGKSIALVAVTFHKPPCPWGGTVAIQGDGQLEAPD